MPNAHHPYVDHVTFAGRIIPLKRPMAAYSARRLERVLPQIATLNQAGKSQSDAAEAMDTTVQTLRHWLEMTQTPWVNLKKRGPYNTKA